MVRLLGYIGVHGNWFLAASIVIGLGLPWLSSLVRPVLPLAIGALLVIALLRVDPAALAATVRQRRPTVIRVWLTQMVLVPVAVWAVLTVTAAESWLPGALVTAMVMAACSASLVGSISIAAIARLDQALALAVVLVSTLSVPVVTPWMAGLLTGLTLRIDLAAFAGRLGLLILGSVAVTLLLRRLIAADRLAAGAPLLDGLFVVAMALAAAGMMEGVGDFIVGQPGRAGLYIAASFLLHGLLQGLAIGLYAGLTRMTGRPAAGAPDRRHLLTVGVLSGFRNLAFLMAALPPDADRGIVLFFALAQFPIYLMPLLTQAVYRRLLQGRRPVDDR